MYLIKCTEFSKWTGWEVQVFQQNHLKSILKTRLFKSIMGLGYFNLAIVTNDPSKGFEIELSHLRAGQWLIRANYTYIDKKTTYSFR